MQTSLVTVLPKDFSMKAATIATVCLWGVMPLEKPVILKRGILIKSIQSRTIKILCSTRGRNQKT